MEQRSSVFFSASCHRDYDKPGKFGEIQICGHACCKARGAVDCYYKIDQNVCFGERAKIIHQSEKVWIPQMHANGKRFFFYFFIDSTLSNKKRKTPLLVFVEKINNFRPSFIWIVFIKL